jgi:hypothetical protein
MFRLLAGEVVVASYGRQRGMSTDTIDILNGIQYLGTVARTRVYGCG